MLRNFKALLLTFASAASLVWCSCRQVALFPVSTLALGRSRLKDNYNALPCPWAIRGSTDEKQGHSLNCRLVLKSMEAMEGSGKPCSRQKCQGAADAQHRDKRLEAEE